MLPDELPHCFRVKTAEPRCEFAQRAGGEILQEIERVEGEGPARTEGVYQSVTDPAERLLLPARPAS